MAAGDCSGDTLHRKLCGYLRAVVDVCDAAALKPGIKVPLLDPSHISPLKSADEDFAKTCASKRRGRRRRVCGAVESVLRQLRTLIKAKCVEAEATLLRVAARSEGAENEFRAVVLVDVYLPISAWSGWQFPRNQATAASLFSHLSCDWEARNSLLVVNLNAHGHHHDENHPLWSISDCHVLHCEIHSDISVVSMDKQFDLYEIFKTLPSVGKEKKMHPTRLKPNSAHAAAGIWDLNDDLLKIILFHLGPRDLVRIASTCHHLRSLAASIMPYMKLKLFPHQEAAVEWMMQRELSSDALRHPLYKELRTEDGFCLHINLVTGDLLTSSAPTINDFRGGLFCDEPGLGKTVTALSLILKTHGTLAEPPSGAEVTWYMHKAAKKCGYYELSSENSKVGALSTLKRLIRRNLRSGSILYTNESPAEGSPGGLSTPPRKRAKLDGCDLSVEVVTGPRNGYSVTSMQVLRCTRSMDNVRRNLANVYEEDLCAGSKRKREETVSGDSKSCNVESNETWVQCDSCRKWRRLNMVVNLDTRAAWFCNMNSDPSYQSCAAPEEPWDSKGSITNLPGFHSKGTTPGEEQNTAFFLGVLRENIAYINPVTKKALAWLAKLSPKELLQMEINGMACPILGTRSVLNKDARVYEKIFQAFGLRRKFERKICRWHYPHEIDNLSFDSTALKLALSKPLDSFRFYLSGATLVVVPSNLVDHWKTQIERHVSPGQLHVYVWGEHKEKPTAHCLAWDYDIVITTFSRLSAEWFLHKRSVLLQVHWLRVVMDEGHTIGSSFALANKVQMAVSLAASSRWILTGTPTPYTPTSQVAHLRPMLEFLHEEAYGQNQEFWDLGIQKPFESKMVEGRLRLIDLLKRTMLSARKSDILNIPPCIKNVVYLHFDEGHAISYNELVATVRRNILMADWNDPSHVESLLNPKQWKFRSTTIRNVRLSCCVAGHIKVTDAGQDIQETMDFLVQEKSLDPLSEAYTSIRISLLNGCCCSRCGVWCRLPVITPCMHLLCLECVSLDSEKCTMPNCGNHYEMQSPASSARPENPNPKWAVPKDLIELQPSYKQDDWDPDWQSTSSSKMAYLVKKLKELQQMNSELGYSINESHSYCPIGVSNEKFCGTFPEKIIVFSQFLEHIHVIEQQLRIAGITFAGMYNPMPSGHKKKSLFTFQHNPNCMVLVMDGSAALGLDLSFVTRVFLMEPIWDRSMEEQVISRAHRMGATRPVYVETLAMRGTIEEQMIDFLQNPDASGKMGQRELTNAEDEGARAHRTLHDFAGSSYLARLTFVQTRVNA